MLNRLLFLMVMLFFVSKVSAGQLPNGQQQFVDANGAPLVAGFVYMYVPGTTTSKLTYVDPFLTTPNANPILLDGAGRATIWGSGQYRQILTDLNGVTIWDQVVSAPVGGPTASTLNGPVCWADALGLNLADCGALTLVAPIITGTRDVSTLIPYQVTPIISTLALIGTFGNAFSGDTNVFQLASYVKATNPGTPPGVVAVFGEGEAAANGAEAWGANVVGVSSVAGGKSIGNEIDCEPLVSGAIANCAVIVAVSTGAFPAENAIQIQTGGSAFFRDGILFNTSGSQVFGSIIKDAGTQSQYGLNFLGGKYSIAEISFPSFAVLATPTGLNSKLQIVGSVNGNPSLEAAGAGGTPATNANVVLVSLGTGGITFTTEGSAGPIQMEIADAATAVDHLRVRGAATGSPANIVLDTVGTDTNRSILLVPSGSGSVSTNGFPLTTGAGALTAGAATFSSLVVPLGGGTPAASVCLDASNNFFKKTSTGPCL